MCERCAPTVLWGIEDSDSMPSSRAPGIVTLRCERRPECAREGFGVLLAGQLVDQLIYSQDGNEVLLVKYLDSVDGEGDGCRAVADRNDADL
jgi:hypothetical protein